MLEDIIRKAIKDGIPLREIRNWLFRALDIVDAEISKQEGDWIG